MILVVTDSYSILEKKAGEKSEEIYLVTTKDSVLIKAKKELNIEGKYVFNVVGDIKRDTIDIIEIINRVLFSQFKEKERILWEIAYSNGCECSIFLEKVLIILKNCISIKGMQFDNIFIYQEKENVILCDIIEAIFSSNKNDIFTQYKSKSDKIYIKTRDKTSITSKVFYGFHKFALFVKLFRYSMHSKKGIREYDFGQAMCSNEVRMINWVNDFIIQMDGIIQYRILCLKCSKAYQFFKDKGIPADMMEQWICFNILISKTIEYIRLYISANKKLKQNFNVSFRSINITNILKKYLYYYITFVMFMRYEDNIICASYFKYNKYRWIEPWCISSYPETRVFFINTDNETKYSRIYNTMVFKDERCYEKYPDIFSIGFFSPFGYDCKKVYDKNNWIRRKYYLNRETMGLFNNWLQSECTKRNEEEQISILWAPSNPMINVTTLESMLENTKLVLNEIINCGCKGICKLHPNLNNLDIVKTELKLYNESECIYSFDNKKDISLCIREADIIITDISTVIFDGISSKKPVICFLNKQQYHMIEYMSEYISIYTDVKIMFDELHDIFSDRGQFNQWKDGYIKKQNLIFECENKMGVNPYHVIKEMIDEEKMKKI